MWVRLLKMITFRLWRFSLALLALSPCFATEFPPRQNKTFPDRVFPGTPKFPSWEELVHLSEGLDGEAVTAWDAKYDNATQVYNLRHKSMPFSILYARSIKDVQQALVFAKKHNMLVSVRSSGHSFHGRSSNYGGVVLDLSQMKWKQVVLNSTRSPAGEIIVQTGNTWLEVYEAVHAIQTSDSQGNIQRRVIVGGSAHTVAMGGYTQGGGHSPMSRMLGLVVDSLLEAMVVLANGTVAKVSESGAILTDLEGRETTTNDSSLFWAIRGGGGGTWGVVTDFTFKLHWAPPSFVKVSASWSLSATGYPDFGSATIKSVLEKATQLSKNWGGYILFNFGDLIPGIVRGSISIVFNHFGNDSATLAEINDLYNFNTTGNQYTKSWEVHDTFLDYERGVYDPPYTNAYLYGYFLQPNVLQNSTKMDELVAFLMSMLQAPTDASVYACTGIMIGGQMNEVAAGVTPINPKYRSGLISLGCGLGWEDQYVRDDLYINNSLKMRDRLAALGEGAYFSETSEDLVDWKNTLWGEDNYRRLLDAKKKWDPENFFWCHNCVGSDLDRHYRPAGYVKPCPESEEEDPEDDSSRAEPVMGGLGVKMTLLVLVAMIQKFL